MKKSWKFFVVIELLIFIGACWQLSHNIPVLIFLTIAIINLYYVLKKSVRSNFNQFQLIVSVVLIIICLLSSPAIWFMVIMAVLFFGLTGFEISGLEAFEGAPWKRKQMIMPETTNSDPKNGRRFKRSWFGNERIGSHIYEWDDLNFTLLSGDTIIDLGNTLLPKEDNIVIIRKGFGRTRILIPLGIGIMVEHSSLAGNLIFEKEKFHLRNESIKIYSEDYDESQRRLKVVTNNLFGDLEVIRI